MHITYSCLLAFEFAAANNMWLSAHICSNQFGLARNETLHVMLYKLLIYRDVASLLMLTAFSPLLSRVQCILLLPVQLGMLL